MIQLRCQVVKAVFYAVCSECSAEGPEELSTQEAHEAVIGCGWDYRTIYPEGHMMPVYLCKTCLEKKPVVDTPPIFTTSIDSDCRTIDTDPGF